MSNTQLFNIQLQPFQKETVTLVEKSKGILDYISYVIINICIYRHAAATAYYYKICRGMWSCPQASKCWECVFNVEKLGMGLGMNLEEPPMCRSLAKKHTKIQILT